ncbi:MAG: glycosyltransferase, partial [Pseudolabrys sp.]
MLQRTSGHSQHTLTLLGDINKLKKAKAISPNSYVLLVDDGSTDRTWDLIEKISNAQPKRVRALK